jgi:hypothetical protein
MDKITNQEWLWGIDKFKLKEKKKGSRVAGLGAEPFRGRFEAILLGSRHKADGDGMSPYELNFRVCLAGE